MECLRLGVRGVCVFEPIDMRDIFGRRSWLLKTFRVEGFRAKMAEICEELQCNWMS